MSNKNYKKGVYFEEQTANYFRGLGYYAIESRGSHGLFDVVCIPPVNSFQYPEKPLMIQSKTSKKYFTKKVMENLKKHSPKWNGIPLISYRIKRGLVGVENLDGKEMRFT